MDTGAYVPAGHEMQSADESLPVPEAYLPAMHSVHADAPPVLYVPDAQKPSHVDDVSPAPPPKRPAAQSVQGEDA